MHALSSRFVAGALAGALALSSLGAQTVSSPEIGYIVPAGGRAGTTIEVKLGIYEWTPDLEVFVLSPQARLEVLGPPGRLLLPEPPAALGQRAYNPLPLPREVPARLVLAAGMPSGALHWRVANANGASSAGIFMVASGPEVVEDENRDRPQDLATLPVTVSGRLVRNEEVDRYRFRAAGGPVTCELAARRLGAGFHGVLEVHAGGRLVADAVDTEGLDTALTFAAEAGGDYTASVRDLDYRGHRSFVYRLSVTAGPRVVTALPAAGRRGETRAVEFLIDTGKGGLERAIRAVAFPADPSLASFDYRLESECGAAPPFSLILSDLEELVEPAAPGPAPFRLRAPGAVTGLLEARSKADRYRLEGQNGELLEVALDARRIGSPLDAVLSVIGPDGKEIARCDDLPGTTDAGLELTLPAGGACELVVGDLAGKSGSPRATYRLSVQRAGADFALEMPERLHVPLGEKAELAVKAARRGPCKSAIRLELTGLPPGVSAPADLVIPPEATELKIPLAAAPDAPAAAALATIRGTAEAEGCVLTRAAVAAARANLAARAPGENLVPACLVACTMKPRCRIWPVESDERTVHQGSTHLAETRIERLEGFQGDIAVEMRSKQPAKFRQGLTGPDVLVPAAVDRFFYPCFLPQGLETVDAYRMAVNAVARVPDARGNIHYLMSTFPADVSYGLTVEGALLKLSSETRELKIESGRSFTVALKILRSPKIAVPVRLALRPPERLEGLIRAEPVVVPPGESEVVLELASTASPLLAGKHDLMIEATAAAKSDDLPAIAGDSTASPMEPRILSHLKEGCAPLVFDLIISVEFAPPHRPPVGFRHDSPCSDLRAF